MKKVDTLKILLAVLLISIGRVNAQDISDMSVKYMLSFDSTKNVFVAWVVPSYETPNAHNADTEEKGVTAQFALKVPKGALVSDIKSIKGEWETSPTKIGNSEYIKGLDDNFEYYVIGKAPMETNYGGFKEDEPVALFTFKTKNLSDVKKVLVVENHDTAIKTLKDNYALNIGSSFYSRSGQRSSVDATPREQFQSQVSLSEMLKKNVMKLNQEFSLGAGEINLKNRLVCFPNPSSEVLNLKILVTDSSEKIQADILDMKGTVLKSFNANAKLGFNELQLEVGNLTEGSYMVRSQVGNQILTKKIMIQPK